MLDGFEILTTSGIVLWRKHYAPLTGNVINSLINDVLIEERGAHARETGSNNAPYRKNQYTLRWTTSGQLKEVGLVFVAVYQSLLHLNWVDNLLTVVKQFFLKSYGSSLKSPESISRLDCSAFDQTFDALVDKLDTGSVRPASVADSETGPSELTPPSSAASAAEDAIGDDDQASAAVPSLTPAALSNKAAMMSHTQTPKLLVVDYTTSPDNTPVPTPDTSRPSTPSAAASHLVTAKAGPGKTSRRARKVQAAIQFSSAPASSGDESATPGRRGKQGKSGIKQKRRWDADGVAVDGDLDDSQLDYSVVSPTSDGDNELNVDLSDVQASQMGSRTGKGQFVLKDLEDEIDAILTSSKISQSTSEPDETRASGLLGTASSKLSGLFRNVVGGKTLTKADLQQPLQQLQSLLLEKNVAREAAERLTSSVEGDLLSQKTASFTSVDKTLRDSMAKALTKMLTPTTSLDLLRSINSTIDSPTPRPYVISIVGVNGVGKSTSLSKIAYFLLQNNFRVLVTAADTFRAGAVEQLRVHVRNLSELSKRESAGSIELYDRGYGKDAAVIARDAITYATNAGKGSMLFDVVLIDTAGRRHNDSRLMSALTKFGQLANPDKIFMVGEALVGTDSVAQARNFAKEFVDSKGQLRNNGVGMDGFIISKCDTVGDMVGTLVSMVHATGIPVVFLGVGQHYGDLRGLNVGWAVDKLMR